MKRRGIVKRAILAFLFLFTIFNILDHVNAYEINYEVGTKMNPVDNTVKYFYRKETAAYREAIDTYNKAKSSGTKVDGIKVRNDGWAYAEDSDGLQITNYQEKHSNSNSYTRYYEYFHPAVNSGYNTGDSSNGTYKKRYYLKGDTSVTLEPLNEIAVCKSLSTAVLYNIYAETDNYRGVYSGPAKANVVTTLQNSNILSSNSAIVIPYNIYRYAIKDGIYISDNELTMDIIDKMWNKFSGALKASNMRIQVSSILRTDQSNAKNGESYYQNIDTAYKFWETTVRGSRSVVWDVSATITGASINGAKAGAANVVNYYDNTLILPENIRRDTQIYIRHIDTTNLNVIDTSTIENGKLITTKSGGASVLGTTWDKWKANIPRKSNMVGYSEYYDMEVSNDTWKFANIKYKNNTDSKLEYRLTDEEKQAYANYKCVGAVIGKADTLQGAIADRNNKLTGDLRKISGGVLDGISSIQKGNAAVVVKGDEENDYIVIDFYYDRQTEVYVRHISVKEDYDISDMALRSGNKAVKYFNIKAGISFRFDRKDPSISTGSINSTNYNIKPEGALDIYQEQFIKPLGDSPIRICNVRYNHPTAGSYWNNVDKTDSYQANNKTILYMGQPSLGNYQCIGAVVGKGNTVAVAENNRSNAKTTVLGTYNSYNNFIEKPIGFSSFDNDSGKYLVTKNDNWTSIELYDNDSDYIVVDFYYRYVPKQEKTVYVRHIDVGTEKNFNSAYVDKAISNGNVLAGLGVASRKTSTGRVSNLSKLKTSFAGYQELYNICEGDTLTVSKDNSEGYTLLGYNIVYNNQNNLMYAKQAMDRKLNSNNKYVKGGESVTTANDASDVIIIDFYYSSQNTGTIIERKKVGRLGFYSVDDVFKSTVDNTTSDVIPSNEYLNMSIDKAYAFMLGAINIKEKKVEDTYEFKYTIIQPYEVTYTHYYSVCPCTGIESNGWSEGDCGISYCNDDGECRYCKYYRDEKDMTAYGEVSVIYTYKIPYKYIYYKVQNMRLYTISKIELLDGYTNDGLPLFDGQTHTFKPKEAYENSFKNAKFAESKSEQTTAKTMTLPKLTYSAEQEKPYNIGGRGALNQFTDTVQNLFNGVQNHSDASRLISFNQTTGKPVFKSEGSAQTVEFKISNDKISFTDNISNKPVVIVGADNDNKAKATEKETGVTSYTSNELYAKKVINLAKYTNGIARNWGGINSGYTYDIEDVDVVTLKTQYPNTTSTFYEPENNLTTKAYYNLENLLIPQERVNGKRLSYGKIYYELLKNNSVLNFDVDDGKTEGKYSWTRTTVSGNDGNKFLDTEMYRKSRTTPEAKTTITQGALKNIVWDYGKDNNKNSDADVVNVFTPVAFKTYVEDTNKSEIIDHRTSGTVTNQIQKNAKFSVGIETTNHDKWILSTNKYIKQYYIKFDFDVQDIKIYDDQNPGGRAYNSGVVSSGTWIGPIYNQYVINSAGRERVSISAFALADPLEATENTVVNQETNEYEVRAIGNNAPNSLVGAVASGSINSKFINSAKNSYISTGGLRHTNYYTQKNIKADSNFVANNIVTTSNISRVYDFKITDLKDVDWKNIFRTSTSTTTNQHSGRAYYSGIKKWNIYTTKYNDLVTRDVSEIGATKQQILPLGPYKHTTTSYVNAPKLGYRFSFDLKTTGAKSDKSVTITPSFYYVSKSGKEYNTNIKLFYKNSNNKYVDISKYKLYMVPDDGYRLTFEGTDAAYRFSSSSILKTSILLGTTKEIKLTSKTMEMSDNTFVQIWYGEYKLPNSTIAVAVDESGNYNVNAPLKNGYIGVKFDIVVNEKNGTKLQYSRDNRNAESTANTSQWDYEGYLGFDSPGSILTKSIKIALEKGIWDINNNDLYNQIKGTVILYDTDAKASDDYN